MQHVLKKAIEYQADGNHMPMSCLLPHREQAWFWPRCEARVVNQKVLLTGRPGSGKTTLIQRVVNKLRQRAGGFYTEEIQDGGARAGFKIVTLDRDEIVFAHVDFQTAERIGKYRIDLSALEAVGVKAIREAVQAQRLVVIYEIGPMEIRSVFFVKQ